MAEQAPTYITISPVPSSSIRLLDTLALALLITHGGSTGLMVIVALLRDDVAPWRREEDRTNVAARILRISGMLQRSAVRLLTGCMFSMTRWLLWPAIATYAIEGLLLLLLCATTDLVYKWPTAAMGVGNLFAAGFLIGAAVSTA